MKKKRGNGVRAMIFVYSFIDNFSNNFGSLLFIGQKQWREKKEERE